MVWANGSKFSRILCFSSSDCLPTSLYIVLKVLRQWKFFEFALKASRRNWWTWSKSKTKLPSIALQMLMISSQYVSINSISLCIPANTVDTLVQIFSRIGYSVCESTFSGKSSIALARLASEEIALRKSYLSVDWLTFWRISVGFWATTCMFVGMLAISWADTAIDKLLVRSYVLLISKDW